MIDPLFSWSVKRQLNRQQAAAYDRTRGDGERDGNFNLQLQDLELNAFDPDKGNKALEQGNEKGRQAVLGVRGKLQGVEDSEELEAGLPPSLSPNPRLLSVSAQVDRLLKVARREKNLALMYFG